MPGTPTGRSSDLSAFADLKSVKRQNKPFSPLSIGVNNPLAVTATNNRRRPVATSALYHRTVPDNDIPVRIFLRMRYRIV